MQTEMATITTPAESVSRIHSPFGAIACVALLLFLGGLGLRIVQEHGHLLPKNVCFTFPRGDNACYDPHRDHMTVDY